MDTKTTGFINQQDAYKQDANNSFSQYLSFRFYKENLDQLADKTKDSINNFLKSITEIEEEFMNIMRTQQMKNRELHDFGFETEGIIYMEENY